MRKSLRKYCKKRGAWFKSQSSIWKNALILISKVCIEKVFRKSPPSICDQPQPGYFLKWGRERTLETRLLSILYKRNIDRRNSWDRDPSGPLYYRTRDFEPLIRLWVKKKYDKTWKSIPWFLYSVHHHVQALEYCWSVSIPKILKNFLQCCSPKLTLLTVKCFKGVANRGLKLFWFVLTFELVCISYTLPIRRKDTVDIAKCAYEVVTAICVTDYSCN